jgi:LysM repeat protein
MANEKLDKILGIDLNLLKILTYRPQREPGSFLRSSDSEKKVLLKEMLQLKNIEDAFNSVKTVHDQKKNKEVIYVVKEGDTLTSIAARFKVPVGALLEWNRLKPKATIRPGDKVIVRRGGLESGEVD